MRIFPPLTVLSLLSACHSSIARPDQDNFTLHAGPNGIQPFVAAVERGLRASAEAEDLALPKSDRTQMFAVEGRGVRLIVNPVPDDRYPNAPMHSTYAQREYRIDLVYQTGSADTRQEAKRVVAQAAKEAGQTLTKFKEC